MRASLLLVMFIFMSTIAQVVVGSRMKLFVDLHIPNIDIEVDSLARLDLIEDEISTSLYHSKTLYIGKKIFYIFSHSPPCLTLCLNWCVYVHLAKLHSALRFGNDGHFFTSYGAQPKSLSFKENTIFHLYLWIYVRSYHT